MTVFNDYAISEQVNQLDVPIRDLVYVAFDTETTGINPVVSRLVELSGVMFRGSGEVIKTMSLLIDPETEIPQEVIAIHGITNEMVRGMPTCREAVPQFISWIQDVPRSVPQTMPVLAAHNAGFDLAFLQVALAKAGQSLPPNPVIDTLSLARKLLPGSLNYKLKTLVEYIGAEPGVYHRAEADSFHVRSLLLKILAELPADTTLKELGKVAELLCFLDPASLAPGQFTGKCEAALSSIEQAIKNGLDLRMAYHGHRRTTRQVTPVALLFSNGIYYLNAFCHLAQNERTFRLDRIAKLETVTRVCMDAN